MLQSGAVQYNEKLHGTGMCTDHLAYSFHTPCRKRSNQLIHLRTFPLTLASKRQACQPSFPLHIQHRPLCKIWCSINKHPLAASHCGAGVFYFVTVPFIPPPFPAIGSTKTLFLAANPATRATEDLRISSFGNLLGNCFSILSNPTTQNLIPLSPRQDGWNSRHLGDPGAAVADQ